MGCSMLGTSSDFVHLPPELLVLVLAHLHSEEIINCLNSALCQCFHSDVRMNESLWLTVCIEKKWIHRRLENDTCYRLLFQNLVRASSLVQKCSVPEAFHTIYEFHNIPTMIIHCVNRLGALADSEEQRIEIGTEDQIECLEELLVTYPQSRDIHIAVFNAFVTISRPLGGVSNQAFQAGKHCTTIGSLIGSSRGIECIINSMQVYEHDAQLQAAACLSLVNISLTKGNKRKIMALNGIKHVTNAVRTHSNDTETQYRGVFAMVNLISSSLSVENMPSDMMDLVLRALKRYGSDSAFALRALLLIQNLTNNADNIAFLNTEAVLDSVKGVVNKDNVVPSVAKLGTSIIEKIDGVVR